MNSMPSKPSKNMEYLLNYWREVVNSKLKPHGALYAEGGPLKADEIQGESGKNATNTSTLSYYFCCFNVLLAL